MSHGRPINEEKTWISRVGREVVINSRILILGRYWDSRDRSSGYIR